MADTRGMVDRPAALVALAKLAIDLRLILLLAAMIAALIRGAESTLLLVMLLASYAGIGLLVWWQRLVDAVWRYPALFIVDLAVTVAILAVAGIDGPFVLYTISTAFLAGVLYGYPGGGIFGLGLAVGYAAAAAELPGSPASFTILVVIPVLIAIAGLGAAALRNLVVHTARVEGELEDAVSQVATAEERARLAREMHDTVGKTLHGIALAAAALPQWLDQRPERAKAQAESLATAAETAAAEARQLIGDLRSDRLDGPLHTAVVDWARQWSADRGIRVMLAVTPVGPLSGTCRYEAFTILREALRNVADHSGASAVSVYLAREADSVVLEIADDGTGMACTDLEALASGGHYGVVGMSERAKVVGGQVTVRSDSSGTTVRAVLPAGGQNDARTDQAMADVGTT